MSIEVRPFGVKCNIACQYCYQNPERDAGNELNSYDLEKMMEVLQADGRSFILFGGEPLLMPTRDLETLWSYGLSKFNGNGLQTNGTLITDEHIELFKKYKVSVGISIDGPGELNDVRWAGSLAKTRKATERTLEAVRKLCVEGLAPSLIVTLHRNNATRDKLPTMHEWLRALYRLGVRSLRLHSLEVESDAIRQKYALTTEEHVEAMLSFLPLESELPDVNIDIFRDMRNMLLGKDNKGTCVWTACDPYTTEAVQGLEGRGQRSNCGRTNKDGVDFVKADRAGFERYLALYQTPQEHGGCKGCRFFLMCKGQCPGTALDAEWRNRTELCDALKILYRHFECELLDAGATPISVLPIRKDLERAMISAWASGRNTLMATQLSKASAKRSSAPPDIAPSPPPTSVTSNNT
jgi:uncharacterized protein